MNIFLLCLQAFLIKTVGVIDTKLQALNVNILHIYQKGGLKLRKQFINKSGLHFTEDLVIFQEPSLH